MNRTTILGCVLALSACADSAPDDPTWIDDVRPILVANCARCHSVPATQGAPGVFRLDKYGNTEQPDGSFEILGAASQSVRIAVRAAEIGDMPPAVELSDAHRDTLQNWVDNAPAADAPKLGERADNGAPEIALQSALGNASGTVELDYEITDPDGDLVDGSLLLRPTVATSTGDVLVAIGFHDGRGTVQFNAQMVAAGDYDAIAVLTDDLIEVERVLGSITIEP